jgi:hypothetical protein
LFHTLKEQQKLRVSGNKELRGTSESAKERVNESKTRMEKVM